MNFKKVPPPPEKLSYPHLTRVWAFALLFVFVFAFVGCTDSTDTEPRVEVETGTVLKRYALYEPISQLENIECDLYFEYHTSRLDSLNARTTVSPYVQFGTRTVDVWRTYKLEERTDGIFSVEFTTSLDPDSSTVLEWYTHTASINYNNLQNENMVSTFVTQINRSSNTKTECNIAWDSKSKYAYYCTWVVDGVSLQHETEHEHWFNRVWTIRLYVLFDNGDSTLTLHEFIFREKSSCWHDENGDEIYEEYSPIYDTDGNLIEENYHSVAYDKFIYERYISQSYTPPV